MVLVLFAKDVDYDNVVEECAVENEDNQKELSYVEVMKVKLNQE